MEETRITLSWGTPMRVSENVIKFLNEGISHNDTIAKCGHTYHIKGIITYRGEKILVKYNILGGRPDVCHECLEKDPSILTSILESKGEIILSV